MNFALPPIYPATRAGADDTRVNFFLAATPEGKKLAGGTRRSPALTVPLL